MEPTECSETSAFNNQTPGKYPEDNLPLLQHGESLKTKINIVVEKISNWFHTNLLILNFNKTYYMHFTTKSKLAVDIQISHKVNPINNTSSTNFLGLTLDSTLSWKTHIDHLSSKINSACYVIRSLKSVISTKNLRTIFFFTC